jgi:DNA helicase II / ATP-dependent DNA helicase PcrA
LSKKKPIKLNDYQKTVVDFRTGFAVCVAAPGSGKTAVMVERLQAMIREGVRPADILSLTFTKEGAKELTERADLKDVEDKVCSTFHSWALGFIKREWQALPFKVKQDWHGHPAPLCLPLDAARSLAMICRHLPNVKWKDAQGYISRMKRRGISPAMAIRFIEHDGEEVFIEAYKRYEHALREKGVMDFDSIVIETANLLKNRPDVLARNQFKFVQVDEAQDTDAVQWSIIKAITQKHGNALAVGDENQGMYSWRGSESNLTSYFCGLFPGAAVFPLPVNYRSTQAIVDYCKEIAPNQNETITNLSTPNEQGVPIVYRLYGREDEEATAVINNCLDLSNTAVLARTNRQLAAFENECGNRNLRYKLLGKSGFWGQNEVRDALAIDGSVVTPTDNNILRALTARCAATKFLRKTDARDHKSTVTLLKEHVERTGVCASQSLMRFNDGDSSQADIVRSIGFMLHSLRGETRNMEGAAGLRLILDRFGVLQAYDEDDNKEENVDNDPQENILKLVDYAGKKGTVTGFYEWTQKVQRALRARTNCLTLSTIHQSKGKEWPYVFVVGVNQDVLPHVKGELEEERRIYFVACSRAAKKLHVSANGVASELLRPKLPKEADGGVVDPWEGFSLLQQ